MFVFFSFSFLRCVLCYLCMSVVKGAPPKTQGINEKTLEEQIRKETVKVIQQNSTFV